MALDDPGSRDPHARTNTINRLCTSPHTPGNPPWLCGDYRRSDPHGMRQGTGERFTYRITTTVSRHSIAPDASCSNGANMAAAMDNSTSQPEWQSTDRAWCMSATLEITAFRNSIALVTFSWHGVARVVATKSS